MQSSPDAVRLTAWVHGYVQGVGFRWWTRSRALELGVVGHATNHPDGRVLVIAEGPRDALERLLAKGGPLDQIVSLSETLVQLTPTIHRMSTSIDVLQETAELLREAVGPLGDLAGKLPGRWLRSGSGGSANSGRHELRAPD